MKDFKNWWYYHKGYVIVAAIAVIAAGRTIYSKVTETHPDLSVAIITDSVIPSDAALQLQEELEKLCGDYNHDGKVVVRIAGYGDPGADALGIEGSAYKTASEAELIGDISSCESYLFVTDDPVKLQRGYQILADRDGSCPADTDYSAEGKTIPLAEALNLSGDEYNEFLYKCSIGRRCFYNEKTCRNLDDLAKFWDVLAGKV